MKAEIRIWLQTLIAGAIYVFGIWLTYLEFRSRGRGSLTLSLVVAFTVVQVLVITLLLGRALWAKVGNEIRQRRATRLEPEIRRHLAACTVAADLPEPLKRLSQKYPDHVDRSLAEFLPSVLGAARHRLSLLAVDLGAVARWEEQLRSGRLAKSREAIDRLGWLSPGVANAALRSALSHPDETIRLRASRALVRSAEPKEIERVFTFATTQSLLTRALVVEELRPHAALLCRRAVPKALASSDPERVRVTLEMVEAWRMMLPLREVFRLLRHAHPAVRAAAFRLLRYALPYANHPSEEVQRQIRAALAHDEEAVQVGAALAAGRMRVVSAIPELSSCLRSSRPGIARAAAYALAEIGPHGWNLLQETSVSARRPAAAVALEALERVKIGRFTYAVQ